MSTRNYCMVSAFVFILVAVAHAWRAFFNLPAEIDGWGVPRFVSIIAVVAALALASWALKSARSLPEA